MDLLGLWLMYRNDDPGFRAFADAVVDSVIEAHENTETGS